MIMSGLVLASAVPTISKYDMSAEYPGYYMPQIDTSAPLSHDQMEHYAAKLRKRLKMCQPAICNKCMKILLTNQRSRRHRACFTLINLKQCCPVRKNFLASGPWWKNPRFWLVDMEKMNLGSRPWIVTNNVLLWMSTSDFLPSAQEIKITHCAREINACQTDDSAQKDFPGLIQCHLYIGSPHGPRKIFKILL